MIGKARSGITVGTLLTGVFVIFAVALTASLAFQFSEAWSELTSARRAGSLAAADAEIFRATQMLRRSRAMIQTVIVSADQPVPEIQSLLARNAAQLKAVDDTVDASLSQNAATLIGTIKQKMAAARALERDVLAVAAKPKAERDVRDSQPWYEAVGVVASDLSDLSRSIAGEARLADPVIGEFVLARQYSWSARDSFGTECSTSRSLFVNKLRSISRDG